MDPTPMQNPTNPPAAPAAPALPPQIVMKDGNTFIKTVVDKVEKLIPLDEATIRLQKDGAAEARLAAASEELRKSQELATRHQNDIKLAELTRRGQAGDRDAAIAALEMLGEDVTQYRRGAPAAPAAAPAPDPRLQKAAALMESLEAEGIDAAAALRFAYNQAAETSRNAVYGVVENAALQDPVLKPLLGAKNKDIANVVMSDLRDRVRYLITTERAEPGPDTYARAIREMSQKYKALGIQAQPPTSQSPGYTHLGIGPSAAISTGASDSYSEQPVKAKTPITASLDEYADNFIRRLRANAARMGDES